MFHQLRIPMTDRTEGRPFSFKDCALAAIATGRRARNLQELRDRLQQAESDSVYHHFWGGRLRPQFDEPEYNNDFAAWVRHALHDQITAERLAVVDPMEFPTIDDLRNEVIDIIEERLSEQEVSVWAKPDEQFSFIRSQIVVFDTHRGISEPAALAREVPHSSTSSIFYHFIDARRRTQSGRDDFSAWLESFGEDHQVLIDRLSGIDPYFASLSELRMQIADVMSEYFVVSNTTGGT